MHVDLTLLHSCTFVSLDTELLCAIDHSSNAFALAQVASQNRLPFDTVCLCACFLASSCAVFFHLFWFRLLSCRLLSCFGVFVCAVLASALVFRCLCTCVCGRFVLFRCCVGVPYVVLCCWRFLVKITVSLLSGSDTVIFMGGGGPSLST